MKLAILQLLFIPSNLLRGYSLREQWHIYRLARRWESWGSS